MPITPMGFCSPGIFPHNQVLEASAPGRPSRRFSSHSEQINAWNARRLVRVDLSAYRPNHTSPTGLCSGCESVPWGDFYILNPPADSLLSFVASPGYYPLSTATLRVTCSLMRFSSLTAHESSSKLVESRLLKQGALQRFNHRGWNPTLTSEISPPEVLWPSTTHESQNQNLPDPVRFWPDSAFLPRRTSPRSQGLLGQFVFGRFGE
jgi:hypothetical protein